MDPPSTPPRRRTEHRTPPSPVHGDAYNGLHPYKAESPPASPAPPAQPKLHSGRKTARSGDEGSNSCQMLPTPSKTPSMTPARKRQRASSMQESARGLHFQPEDPNDSMPTPRQARKHKRTNTGDLGDDYSDFHRQTKSSKPDIQIYTEVQARVPEDDTSDDNVFQNVPRGRTTTVTEPVNHRRTRGDWNSPSPSPVRMPFEHEVDKARIEAAVRRGEGMYYVFRGKRVYRKFADLDDVEDAGASSHAQQQLRRATGGVAHRPITRSQIGPRLLWPSEGHRRTMPSVSFTDEEAETDVDMPAARHQGSESQEHDSGVSFVAPTVHATPVKHDKSKRKSMITPPTTARTTRQSVFDNPPSFEETLEADDEAPADAAMPTPQRSSRKKKVSINDVPIYEDDASDPVQQPTPVRARSTRNTAQLTPIVEDSEEPISAGHTSPNAAKTGRRAQRSPFDSWQRTKPGKKRGTDAVDASTEGEPVKRSRSVTRHVGRA